MRDLLLSRFVANTVSGTVAPGIRNGYLASLSQGQAALVFSSNAPFDLVVKRGLRKLSQLALLIYIKSCVSNLKPRKLFLLAGITLSISHTSLIKYAVKSGTRCFGVAANLANGMATIGQ